MATDHAGVSTARDLCSMLFELSDNAISLDYELSTDEFLQQLSSRINSTCLNPPSELTQLGGVKHNLITTLKSHPSVLNERIHHGAGLLHTVMVMPFPGRMEILNLFQDIDGFDANIRDDDLQTPLHYALSILNVKPYIKENPHPDSCGSLFDIVKFLIDSGANVNFKNKDGMTPLLIACSGEKVNEPLVRLLLDHGAEVNVQDRIGNSIIHLIIDNYSSWDVYDVLKLLIDRGIDINLPDNEGVTPLHLACARNQDEPRYLRLLLNHGANIDAQDEYQETPVMRYIKSGTAENCIRTDLCEYLISPGANVNLKNKDRMTPLLIACSVTKVDEPLLRLLLDHGADINVQDSMGNSSSHLIIKNYSCGDVYDVLKILVGRGININLPNYQGMTPLHLACGRKLEEPYLRLLLNHGANIDAPDEFRETPLMRYIKSSTTENCIRTDLCKYLISPGANVNFENKDGMTPLLIACSMTKVDEPLLRLLLDYGADINVQDSMGNSSSHLIIQNYSSWPVYDVLKLLVDRGININLPNKHGMTPLHLACSQKVEELYSTIRLLLDHGANIDAQDKYQETPLMRYIKSCTAENCIRSDLCNYLISPGVNVNLKDIDGRTPLLAACSVRKVHEPLLGLLLDHGADINVQDRIGNSPSHLIIKNYSCRDVYDVLKILVGRGMNINLPNYQGMTPLHLACGGKLEEPCLRLLVNHGANIDAQDEYQETPLMRYIKSGTAENCIRTDLCKYLISPGANVNFKNKDGMTPLFIACSVTKVDEPLVKLLLDHGADINGQDRMGNSPSHLIIKNYSCWDVLKLLVHRGININLPNKQGMTPLHLACSQKVEELYSTIRLLLDHGANIDAQDKYQETPLMRYIKSCTAENCIRSDLCNYLISPGVNVNLKNMDVRTPLLVACSVRKVDEPLLRLLLDHGADINVQDPMGNSSSHLIIQNYSCWDVYDVLKLLVDRGININLPNKRGMTPLHLACSQKLKELYSTIRLLLDHGANIDAQDKYQETPLMRYIKCGTAENCIRSDICNYLISPGANVNLKNMDDMTPLLIACSGEKVDEHLVRLLLDHGADINVQDRMGNSPSHLIIKNYSCWEVYDVLKLLVDRGIKINSPNNQGKTPLHLACSRKLKELYSTIKLLLDHGANIDAQDIYHETPLTTYIKSATAENCIRTDLCKYLISPAANVNFKEKDGMTILLIACSVRKVDEPLLRLLLDHGADINVQDPIGNSPSHLIIKNHSCQEIYGILKLFVDRGININLPNNKGMTPLHMACGRKLEEPYLRLIVNHDAYIDAQDIYQETPLMRYIKSGTAENCIRTNLCNYLISLGANVNLKDIDGRTPLLIACSVRNVDEPLLRLLLDHGADFNVQDPMGNSPTHLIIRNDSCLDVYDILKLFVGRGININLTDNEGMTPLHLACGGQLEEPYLRLLVNLGANINAQDNYQETPLMRYIMSVAEENCIRSDICKYLISPGANVNFKNEDGMTTLLIACFVRKVDEPLLRLLLDHGADINVQDSMGNSSSHLIIQNYSCWDVYDVLKIFVDRGININLPNNQGMTPLHLACSRKLRELYSTIRLLFDHGANIDAQDEFRETPLMRYIIESSTTENCIRTDLCKYLISPCANVNLKNEDDMTPLLIACSGKKLFEPLIRLLLDQGADINVQDRMGNSPSHLIIQNDSCLDVYDILKLLVDRGININLPNNQGKTPLHLACSRKLKELYSTIRLLLDHGANIDARDEYQETPLMRYIKSGTAENCIRTDLCKYLISPGANVNFKNKDGMTPLFSSVRKVDEPVLRLLLDHGADINVQDRMGNSPSHLIIQNYSCWDVYDVLKLLVDRGININLPNNYGTTPLHFACSSLLKEQCFGLLLDHGANVNACDMMGCTPLMLTISYNVRNFHLWPLLITRGANVNSVNAEGNTLLHLCCMYPSDKFSLDVLLDFGAVLDAQNNKGDTPLHLLNARGYTIRQFHNHLRLLLSRGANLMIKNHHGKTAFEHCSNEIREIDELTVPLAFHAASNKYSLGDREHMLRSSAQNWSKFRDNFKRHLASALELKKLCLPNRLLSVYDFLMLSDLDTVRLPRKPSLQEDLKKIVALSSICAPYQELIANKIKSCEKAKEMLCKAQEALNIILFRHALPSLVIDTILSYLRERKDLLQIIQTGFPDYPWFD